jgi:hypothetical protein
MDLEEMTEDAVMLGVIFGSMAALIFCQNFIPPPYGQSLGIALYFIITVLGTFGTTLWARECANKYPYLEAIVRPDNKRLHLFVESDISKGRPLGKNVYEAYLHLAQSVKYADYGKVRDIIIQYTGKWSNRVHLRPGRAVWRGIRVEHPQTEIIELVQSERTTTSIDHGSPIPVFILRSASKDVYAPPRAFFTNNPGGFSQESDMAKLQMRLSQLAAENAKLKRDAITWQQRALSYEDVVVQQRAETAGLLDAKAGIKEHAYETMLGFYQAFASFDKAMEAIRGRRFAFSFNKWVALTIISVVAVAFLWANPQIITQAQIWLSNPYNFGITAIALVVVLAIILYAQRRKK